MDMEKMENFKTVNDIVVRKMDIDYAISSFYEEQRRPDYSKKPQIEKELDRVKLTSLYDYSDRLGKLIIERHELEKIGVYKHS